MICRILTLSPPPSRDRGHHPDTGAPLADQPAHAGGHDAVARHQQVAPDQRAACDEKGEEDQGLDLLGNSLDGEIDIIDAHRQG